MPFVKMQKNKAYYKRIQTKNRRRREGKTDYYARQKMVAQHKNKFNTPKFRLVIRFTNKRVIAQVVYSTIRGDRTLCQADSKELLQEKFGVAGSVVNYPAAYATGYLIGRRVLQKVGLDKDIEGVEADNLMNGEEYHVEDEGTEKKSFKCILDCGLIRTITGSRLFAALKGAADSGLHIPHSVKKFTGYEEPEDRGADYSYDAAANAERLSGATIQEYAEMLKEEDPDRYQQQFSKLIEADKAEDIEDMWKAALEAIKGDPSFTKKASAGITNTRMGNQIKTSNGTQYPRMVRRSKAERKNRVSQKMQEAFKAMTAE